MRGHREGHRGRAILLVAPSDIRTVSFGVDGDDASDLALGPGKLHAAIVGSVLNEANLFDSIRGVDKLRAPDGDVAAAIDGCFDFGDAWICGAAVIVAATGERDAGAEKQRAHLEQVCSGR